MMASGDTGARGVRKNVGMFRRRAQGSRPADGSVGRGLGEVNWGPAAGSAGADEAAVGFGDAGILAGSEALGSLGGVPAGVDARVPHPARIWNYWLGGRDYFAADRAAGFALGQEFPHVTEIARAERAFLVRAVRFLAGPARMRQFLDIGAGLPAGGNTHEIAQRIAPDSGIVYADHDPVVLAHARALLASPMLASSPEGVVSYIQVDLRDVTAVLTRSAHTLDHGKPVALMMLGVLGYIDDHGAARSIVSQLMDALPSGSYLAIADGVAAEAAAAMSRACSSGTTRPRRRLTGCSGRTSWPASSTGWTWSSPGWCRVRSGSRTCVRLPGDGGAPGEARRLLRGGQEAVNGPPDPARSACVRLNNESPSWLAITQRFAVATHDRRIISGSSSP